MVSLRIDGMRGLYDGGSGRRGALRVSHVLELQAQVVLQRGMPAAALQRAPQARVRAVRASPADALVLHRTAWGVQIREAPCVRAQLARRCRNLGQPRWQIWLAVSLTMTVTQG